MTTLTMNPLVSIEEIENAVAFKNYPEVMQKIKNFVDVFESNRFFDDKHNFLFNQVSPQVTQSMTRLAAAIGQLILDPGFEVNANHLVTFAFAHRTIHAIFYGQWF